MTGFDVTAAELGQTAAVLSELSSEIQSAVGSLHAEVEGVLGSGWRGGAARGFAAGWQQWRQGAEDVLAGLAGMAQLLDATGTGYGGAEADSLSTINGARPL